MLVLPAPARAEERLAWPLRGPLLTQYRNGSDPYAAGQHRGIDIGAPVGAAVRAAADGSVTFAGSAGSSGLTVSMRSSDGRFDLSYLHLSALSVRKGEAVAASDPLGQVGTSGKPSDPRPHLHFGVRDAGSAHGYRDPLDLLPPPLAAPAPDAPRVVPVPLPAPPVRPAPAPGAAPRPLGDPAARPAPRPRAQPGRRPARAPRPAPSPSPTRRPAPGPRALSRPVGAGERSPRIEPRVAPAPPSATTRARRHAPERTDGRSPVHGAGAERRARPLTSLGTGPEAVAPTAGATSSAPARVAAGAGRGPDLGWLLACAGAGLAALVLAVPGGARRAGALVRASAAALRRPLGPWVQRP